MEGKIGGGMLPKPVEAVLGGSAQASASHRSSKQEKG